MTADTTAAEADGRHQANEAAGTPARQLVLHTAEEAARLLKVKRSWLERQAAARKIPFSMLGGSYRFSDRHLAEIVHMNEQLPVSATPDVHRPPPPRTSRKAYSGGESSATVAPLRPRPRNAPQHT